MIYTFGSSFTKWYWPTWSDWLELYQEPVTNLAYSGYDTTKIYWGLVDQMHLINKNDQVYIMWPGNTTLSVWYDLDWIEKHDIAGFFPDANGQLWYTKDNKWQGLYKQHPEFHHSFTNLLIHNIQCILDAQLLLEKIGCKYTMLFNINPWIDIRPNYGKDYQIMWDKLLNVDSESLKEANEIIKLSPISNMLKLLNTDNFIGISNDVTDLKSYKGLWEYDIKNKKYILHKNQNDMHPCALAHHDYLLEKILGRNPLSGKYRDLALKITEDCSNMEIPKYRKEDYIATPEMQLLKFNLKNSQNLN